MEINYPLTGRMSVCIFIFAVFHQGRFYIMNGNLIFSHYCDWYNMPDNVLASCFALCRDLGMNRQVFSDKWCERILRDPHFIRSLRFFAKDRVEFFDMHAPFGECFDLACMGQGRRDDMIKDHIRMLGYASDFGCRTYTIHVGAYDSVVFRVPNEKLRPLAVETLEKLLPYAEKYGVIIAVENSFERSNTPDEVMYYIDYFDHPNLGCCFDSGHANVMKSGKDKVYGDSLKNFSWWGNLENYDGAFEKLAPAMVTCHLHDNNGLSDQHLKPGAGNEDWELLAEKLLTQAPKLLSIQSEVNIFSSEVSMLEVRDLFRKYFPMA